MLDDVQTILPDSVIDFLGDIAAVEFAQKFVEKYSLKDEDVPRVMGLAEDVVYKRVSVAQLPIEIGNRFGIDASKSTQAALEMAEARLLPIQDVVPGVANQVRAWGGEIKLQQVNPGGALTAELFVETELKDVLQEMVSHLQSRLAHLLTLYVSKHSDRAQIVDMLTRAQKVGGLEFTNEDAEELLKFVDEKMVGKEIQDGGLPPVKTPAAPVVTQPQPAKKIEPELVQKPIEQKQEIIKPVSPPTVVSKPAKPDVFTEEDRQEIEKHEKEKQVAMQTPLTLPATVEEMVGQICEVGPMKFDDPNQTTRCKQIVESRLREVRNAGDTRAQLERSFETGGLGVTGRKLADMVQIIEEGVEQLMRHAREKIAEEKEAYLQKQQSEQREKETLAQTEEKLMTKRYVELTGKVPEAHVAPAAPPMARTTAALGKTETLDQRAQKIDTEKVRSIVEAAKAPAIPTSVPKSIRPDMKDVKFVKRLSGPIDQLRTLSLVDFRRMAKDPSMAAEKILDQVHLVEEEGYERKVEAIRAWQSSPLYQLYLQVTRQALQEGKPLESVRSDMAKTTDMLSKEELAEVLKLNNVLRF